MHVFMDVYTHTHIYIYIYLSIYIYIHISRHKLYGLAQHIYIYIYKDKSIKSKIPERRSQFCSLEKTESAKARWEFSSINPKPKPYNPS